MTDDEFRKQVADLTAKTNELAERLKALEPKPEFKREPVEPFDPFERVSRPAVKELPKVASTDDQIARLEQQLALVMAMRRIEQHEPWKLEMMKAVPDSLVRDIVRDQYRGVPPPSSAIPQQSAEPVKRGTGWQEPRPLESPPGQQHIDRLMDAEDRQWRAERARELGVAPPAAIKRRV